MCVCVCCGNGGDGGGSGVVEVCVFLFWYKSGVVDDLGWKCRMGGCVPVVMLVFSDGNGGVRSGRRRLGSHYSVTPLVEYSPVITQLMRR